MLRAAEPWATWATRKVAKGVNAAARQRATSRAARSAADEAEEVGRQESPVRQVRHLKGDAKNLTAARGANTLRSVEQYSYSRLTPAGSRVVGPHSSVKVYRTDRHAGGAAGRGGLLMSFGFGERFLCRSPLVVAGISCRGSAVCASVDATSGFIRVRRGVALAAGRPLRRRPSPRGQSGSRDAVGRVTIDAAARAVVVTPSAV